MFFGNRMHKEERPFFIYYGLGTPEACDRLREETLVIVEPRQWDPELLASLRAGGTHIYGYLSVMESPSWNTERMRRLSDADFWLSGGGRVHFSEWDSFLMDIRSPSYRNVLLEEWQGMSERWELDGMLLDTVGDIEEFIPADKRDEASRAYRSFLSVAASRFSKHRRIQNRGFIQLDSCTSLLNGFLWEDWRAEWKRDAWASVWIDKLRRSSRERGLTLYAASSRGSAEDGKSARKLGFLHRELDPGYGSLPGD